WRTCASQSLMIQRRRVLLYHESRAKDNESMSPAATDFTRPLHIARPKFLMGRGAGIASNDSMHHTPPTADGLQVNAAATRTIAGSLRAPHSPTFSDAQKPGARGHGGAACHGRAPGLRTARKRWFYRYDGRRAPCRPYRRNLLDPQSG